METSGYRSVTEKKSFHMNRPTGDKWWIILKSDHQWATEDGLADKSALTNCIVLVLTDRPSNPRSTTLEALTITDPTGHQTHDLPHWRR